MIDRFIAILKALILSLAALLLILGVGQVIDVSLDIIFTVAFSGWGEVTWTIGKGVALILFLPAVALVIAVFSDWD